MQATDGSDRGLSKIRFGRWPTWVLLCGFWAVPALFEAVQYYLSLAETGNPQTWLHATLRASVRWGLWALFTPLVLMLARRIPLRRGLRRVVASHVVLAVIVTAVQLTALAIIFEYTFYSSVPNRGWSPGYTIYRVLLNSFGISMTAYWFIVAVYYAFEYYREAQERAVAAARLEASLSLARFEALRMQLNPHFLFNTLHAISTLAQEGNRRATTRMLTLLGDLLRLTLDRPETLVTLADELDHAGRYLEIERIRFADRLNVNWEVDAEVLDAEVPSFLLQPILENAIRHGIATDPRPGTISIRGQARANRLLLAVRNSGERRLVTRSSESRGIGLRNTSERLACMYGADFRLALEEEPSGGALATIDLPLSRRPDASTHVAETVPAGVSAVPQRLTTHG